MGAGENKNRSTALRAPSPPLGEKDGMRGRNNPDTNPHPSPLPEGEGSLVLRPWTGRQVEDYEISKQFAFDSL